MVQPPPPFPDPGSEEPPKAPEPPEGPEPPKRDVAPATEAIEHNRRSTDDDGAPLPALPIEEDPIPRAPVSHPATPLRTSR
jgi:hypothetical protein